MKRLKPKFWAYRDVAAGSREELFNFRRIWKLTVFLTTGAAVIPLIFFAIVDYHLARRSVESENLLRTARVVSNTRRSISFFFSERRAALAFIVKGYDCEVLNKRGVLEQMLKNMKNSFGGFTDLGLIDQSGNQRRYIGPFKLLGKNYSDQSWYKEVLKQGVYISSVFLGFRHVPHMIIAVKRDLPNGSFYILRATLDTKKFDDLLSGIEIAGRGDAFIINQEGILQTNSRYHGRVLERIGLSVPKYAQKTRVFEAKNAKGTRLIIGYRYISGTPFILMVIKHKRELMSAWYETRMKLIGLLIISIIVIFGVIIGVATYLVNKIYEADQIRITTLHQVEYTNKMASIGRLAAGVAHELNNPLAIINEKAGLIKDLFTFKKCTDEKQLIGLLDSILSSVKRAGAITKRLLSFSRHMEVTVQQVNLKELIEEVLSFLAKEAEYRGISISVEAPQGIPSIKSDRGKLQEIFLNLFNNAFAAMADGGHLDIKVKQKDMDHILVTIADDGCGIPKEDLTNIFEPFFSTKTKKGGTGLGLSLTRNFVREIGGAIAVESMVGKGTTFLITLPKKMDGEDRGDT
ncbi:MAG: two-component sensor histidine kinase [Desulfococcus sp. 4484_242]|nr:MAG: two-component sensor histidine kinase [Desulfococcus sp. 4484_242]